jgi:hypothetical protein
LAVTTGGGSDRALWIFFLNTDGTVRDVQRIDDSNGGFGGTLDGAFGGSVTAIGDLDGDPAPDVDLAVGASTFNAQEGAVWILNIGPDGTVNSERRIANGESGLPDGSLGSDNFGSAVAGLGDLEGNGVPDLLVGAPNTGPLNDGGLWILYLNADGSVLNQIFLNPATSSVLNALQNSQFGSAVAGIGNLDSADGPDFVSGAPRLDDAGPGDTEEFDEGAVFVAFGAVGLLPVEMGRFDVVVADDRARLSWTTLSELNNARFDVLHRAPEASSWATIGVVEGAGTTTETTTYTFETGALTAGTHAFRLRQVDYDGTATLKDVRTIEIRGEQAVRLRGANPVQAGAGLVLEVQVETAQDTRVAVYNMLGQIVSLVHEGPLAPGTPLQAPIETGNLPSGRYFVRVTGPSIQAVRKFTVVQ